LNIHFLSHELGQVLGETVGVVEEESILAGDNSGAGELGLLADLLKEANTAIQGAPELVLLLLDELLDTLGVNPDLREGIAHLVHHHVHKVGEEATRGLQLLVGITNSPKTEKTAGSR